MNADHARYTDWDAAYLLGALSPADRAEFETHLSECTQCRDAMAEIAPMLGLMSRVPPERAASMLRASETESPAPEHRARVLSFSAAQDRRRRRQWIVGIAAAAAIIVAAVAVPLTSTLRQPGLRTFALEQMIDAPLSASVSLADVAWGTRIDMTCAYGSSDDAPADGLSYALVVIADDGSESVLSTWQARPDTTARLSAGTALPSTDIAAVEIRGVASGDVLMRTPIDER